MNKFFGRGMFCGFIMAALLLLIVACSVPDDENKLVDITPTVSTTISGNLDKDAYNAKIQKIQTLLERYYIDDIDYDKMTEGLYAGLMESLGDPYSLYYSAEDYAEFNTETEGNYAGVGSTVTTNKDGNPEFVKPFKNGPAYKAGILPGDILCEVDGESVLGLDLDYVVSLIRGEPGTSVHIKIYRDSISDYIELDVVRAQVEVETVEYQMLENNIGYVIVTEFDGVTADQFIEAIDDLEAQGMKGLIVDLRDNPGGMLTTVKSMLSRILPNKSLLVYMEYKDGDREEYYSDSKKTVDVPIAVLINGNSASASEVFAGCLRDYEKATLVGTQSFGKGIVQSVVPLGDGSAIKLTTSKYYSPKGTNIHGVGFTPDIIVELDPSLKGLVTIPIEQDNQLQAAVECIEKQIQ